ncbi:hypothetical protein Vadar_010561 [Vaccinium darrowii]|uniref:Uncharacterized protein n=1 Tax=Vaccinium darrowii TaxID=229202 RepID=A0ACB7Y7A3_9ERIC|nr:hypothetical protein Vadar_010561 [Vaccinium darrowii]
MESSILLLCKYGSFTLVVKVATGFRFEDFVGSIHRKWNELISRSFNLLYVVSEHRNCVLENDDDFDNMLALATSYGVSCVEVYICVEEIQSLGCFDLGNSSGNGECRTVQILEDPLEKFCHHNETKRLSADWASLITHGRYKGTLLAAVGKDANQGLFPLAYGIVDSETDDNWLWFLIKLKGILSTRELSIITDRHTGLVKHVPEVFSNCYHAYCLEHLKNNLRDRLSGRAPNGFRERVVNLFVDCAHAPTVSDFDNCVKELCEVGGEKAKEFISSVSYDHWANAYFPGKRYGEMSSNAVESFNSWIREARKMPILQCVEQIRVQIMRQMYERKQLSRKWCSVVCPEMDLLLKNRFDKGKTWPVYGSSDEVFEVSSFPAVVVDIRNKSFTALQKIGVDMSQYIDPLYTIEAFRKSYDCPINPIPSLGAPEVTKETAIILPPKTRRPRGRPKVARIRSRGEKVRQIRCSRCQKLGRHNRKSCKEPCD